MPQKIVLPVTLFILILTGCATTAPPSPPSITADYIFLGENYGRAGLVLTVCNSDARAGRRPPDNLRIRANMMETAEWAAMRSITFDQPRAYIDAPDLVGVDQWGQAMPDAEAWHELSGGCYERIIERAFNAIREWDNARACPVTSFSLWLDWGDQQIEVDLPCAAPLFIVHPSEQLPPKEQS